MCFYFAFMIQVVIPHKVRVSQLINLLILQSFTDRIDSCFQKRRALSNQEQEDKDTFDDIDKDSFDDIDKDSFDDIDKDNFDDIDFDLGIRKANKTEKIGKCIRAFSRSGAPLFLTMDSYEIELEL